MGCKTEYAEVTLPLTLMMNLCELQTIAGCRHVFNYIESRRDRITSVRPSLPLPQQGQDN